MKVYNHGSRGNGTIFVAPGKDHPETSEWIKVGIDEYGNEIRHPTQFTVKFENGVAEVPDGLGRYLIDHKLARKSPLILREGALVLVPPTERRVPQPVGRPLDELLD